MDKWMSIGLIGIFSIIMGSAIFAEYNESHTSIEMAKLGYVQKIQDRDKIWVKDSNNTSIKIQENVK